MKCLQRMESELDIVTLLNTVKKLKAGLSVLIASEKDPKKNQMLISKTRELYMNSSSISLFDNLEKNINMKYKFWKFCGQNYRAILKGK